MKFIKNVIKTMKDTTWLNARETRKNTTTVVTFSLMFIAFFAIIDWVIQSALALLV